MTLGLALSLIALVLAAWSLLESLAAERRINRMIRDLEEAMAKLKARAAGRDRPPAA